LIQLHGAIVDPVRAVVASRLLAGRIKFRGHHHGTPMLGQGCIDAIYHWPCSIRTTQWSSQFFEGASERLILRSICIITYPT